MPQGKVKIENRAIDEILSTQRVSEKDTSKGIRKGLPRHKRKTRIQTKTRLLKIQSEAYEKVGPKSLKWKTT